MGWKRRDASRSVGHGNDSKRSLDNKHDDDVKKASRRSILPLPAGTRVRISNRVKAPDF